MGARGPKRTPTDELVARGSPRGKRRKEKPAPETPAPTRAQQKAPSWLLPQARDYWELLVPELTAAGAITLVDLPALAVYCQYLGKFAALEKRMAHAGAVASQIRADADGVKRRTPEALLSKALTEVIRSFGREFGLTPGSRSSLAGVSSAPAPQLSAVEGPEEKASREDDERFFGAG